MTVFATAEELYTYLGQLFLELADNAELVEAFRNADTVVRFVYRKPDAQVTIRMLKAVDPTVELGASDLEPEVTMTMDADVAHRFWLGAVNPVVAMTRGQIKATGPVSKILKLMPVLKSVFPRYQELLERAGRSDLLEGV